MPETSYKQMHDLFSNQQTEGLITPANFANLVDAYRPSVAIESFRGVTGTLSGVALARANWDYHAGVGWVPPSDTVAPDWFFPRPLLAATQATRYSRVTGYLRPTGDNAGFKYRSDSLPRLFLLNWSMNGATSHSTFASVSMYVGKTWETSVRHAATPFDTGFPPETPGVFPFAIGGSEHILMVPDDEVRLRFEYLGKSRLVQTSYSFVDGFLNTNTVVADDQNPSGYTVTIDHMTMSLTSLGVVETPLDTRTDGGVVLPSSDSDEYYNSIYSDTNWKSSGIPEYKIIA